MKNVIIENLPETKNMEGAKRWVEDKGEFVQVSYREDVRHVAYFELMKGFTRGSHYHNHKEEVFYIIDGCVRGVFYDLETGEKEAFIFKKGDKIRVRTGCAHIFYGEEDSHAIEYSNQYYDSKDAYPYDFETLKIDL